MFPVPSLFALLPGIGGGELVIILLVVLLLFGGEKMPQLAKGLGKAMREFRKAASGVEQEFKRALDEIPDDPPPPRRGPPPAPGTPPTRLEPPPSPGTPPGPPPVP